MSTGGPAAGVLADGRGPRSSRRFGPGTYRPFDVLLFRLPGHAEVIFELEAKPEFGRGPKVSGQPQGGVGGDSAAAAVIPALLES